MCLVARTTLWKVIYHSQDSFPGHNKFLSIFLRCVTPVTIKAMFATKKKNLETLFQFGFLSIGKKNNFDHTSTTTHWPMVKFQTIHWPIGKKNRKLLIVFIFGPRLTKVNDDNIFEMIFVPTFLPIIIAFYILHILSPVSFCFVP